MSGHTPTIILIEKAIGLALIIIGVGILYIAQQVEGLHWLGYIFYTLTSVAIMATGFLTIFARSG